MAESPEGTPGSDRRNDSGHQAADSGGRCRHAVAESREYAVKLSAEQCCTDDDGHCDQRGDQAVLDGRCAVFVTKEGLNKLNDFHGGYLLLGG